jgi:hypothetical protein
MHNKIPNTGAPLPLNDLGTKSFIRKSFRWVKQRVLCKFEMYKVAFRRSGRDHLVWVMYSRQSPETGFYVAISGGMWYSKVLVEVACPPNIPICFIYCIEKVRRYNYYMYAPPVLDVPGRSRLRFGVACTNCDTVVNALHPSCDKLKELSAFIFLRCQICKWMRSHLGEMSSQRERVNY